MSQTKAATGSSSRSDSQPIDKFVNGPVHVSIWENTSVKGAFRAATIQLRYKDAKEGWKTGNSYGAADLQHLENAAREARLRIENWQQRNKANATTNTAT